LAVDLHLHSTCSDGLFSPEEIVKKAEGMGLKGLAITDHDTVAGTERAIRTSRRIEVVPGVELSTETEEEEIHLLGYFINYSHPDFLSFLEEIKQSRAIRLEKMLSLLEQMGYPLGSTGQKLFEISNPGRMHVARALVAEGYVRDTDRAFARLLERDRPAYVPRYKLHPEEGLELILEAGGLPVIAHPIDLQDMNWIKTLRKKGLVGLEVYHPRHPRLFIDYLQRLSREENLLPTGGSDCHGPDGEGKFQLGKLQVPDKYLEGIRKFKEANIS